MIRHHTFDGERCIHCGVNIYDCDCPNNDCCIERDAVTYTVETPPLR